MKKLILILSLSLSPMAHANDLSCDPFLAVDEEGDRNYQSLGRSLAIGEMSPQRLNALNTLTKRQLMFMANDDAPVEYKSVVDAVEFLKEGSEAGEVYLEDVLIRSRAYTILTWYPGGNEYAIIFRKGTLKEIAAIEDGDVYCVGQ